MLGHIRVRVAPVRSTSHHPRCALWYRHDCLRGPTRWEDHFMRKHLRFRLAPLLGMVAILTLSGCLSTIGTQKRVTSFQSADPAFMPVYWGAAQVFSTNRWPAWGVRYHVPSYTLTIPGGQALSEHDALPNLPSWTFDEADPTKDSETWAPTVRYIGGRYLLMFSNSSRNMPNHEMCIGAATSTSLAGTFSPTSFQLCGPAGHQFIDPQLFVDPGTNRVYLLWSDQWGFGGNSAIRARQLSSNGLGLVGGQYTLITYARTSVAAGGGRTGSKAVVENPALVKDPYNNYDLLVSFGTWNEANSYSTIEIPCLAPTGSCIESRGAPLNLVGQNPGGASLMSDGSPNYNYMMWHAGLPDGQRYAYLSETTAVNLNSQLSIASVTSRSVEAPSVSKIPFAPVTESLSAGSTSDRPFNRDDRASVRPQN